MGPIWLDEIELLKKTIHNLKADRDQWKAACIDMVVYEQYGYGKVTPARHLEIFDMCFKATAEEEVNKWS